MKRKSCIQYNTHKKDIPIGCKLNKICQERCDDYQRKGCMRIPEWDGESKPTKKQLAKHLREEKAFQKAIKNPYINLIKDKKIRVKQKSESEHLQCPNCNNNKTEDIIRLREGLHQCRLCNEIFMKDNIMDSFDFDGLEE